ncbi:MAG: histidine ammonia-lyase [Chitinophagales bacterium]
MQIDHQHISIDRIAKAISNKEKLSLSEEAKNAILKCRQYLDNKVKNSDKLFYGINTGFGSLCNIKISKEDTQQLQENLVKSHACGVGKEVSAPIVKLMILLKIQSLSYGHSGVAMTTVERLIDFYNHDIIPVVYDPGSLGASGDLAPLAHLSLPLLGLGDVYFEGEKISGAALLQKMNWQPLELQSKEGLALLNGTQFMAAYGVHLLIEAKELLRKINTIACISLDAYDCRPEPFNPLVHHVRKHQGQIKTATFVNELLADSDIFHQEKTQVQDPYSFRCIPQVHGASTDVLRQVEATFTTEINSVTDNPNVFPDEDMIISGGNFHGQPLAMALDYLKLALAELGSIAERRIYLLMMGERNLPAFLVNNPGLNSGFMIVQYTAAALVSKNKQLCTPASADTVPSSNGQEDHVSMGANAATQCLEIFENLKEVVAIELFVSAQALSFRKNKKTASKLTQLIAQYREKIPFVAEDREMYTLMQESKEFLNEI